MDKKTKNSEYVGVNDEFIPEEEKYVDSSYLENNKKVKSRILKGGIAYFIVFFIIFIGMGIFIFKYWGEIANDVESSDVKVFNNNFELRTGTQNKTGIEHLLDDIVTNNKTEKNHIIKVTYNQTTTSDPNSIVEIKHSLDDNKDYEVSADYDSNGFINKITIKDI